MDSEPSPVATESMESPITNAHHSDTATMASMAMAGMVGENDENNHVGGGGNNNGNDNILDGGESLMAAMGSSSERLALLQEFYQRKHAELLQQLQTQNQAIATAQDYLQSLQLFQSLQQQQHQQQQPNTTQQPAPHVRTHPHHHPYLASLRQQTSSDQSMDEVEMMGSQPAHAVTQPPLSSTQSTGGLRGTRRTMSGSGQTISQTTRDRLKTMIASKKHKQRLHSSCSTGSTSSIVGSVGAWKGMGGAGRNTTNSEINLPHSTGASGTMGTATSIASAGSKPHFQPYPLPSPAVPHTYNATAQVSTEGAADSELQLRKVNSEPNLKMRIRARLLSKGSSPVTVTQHQRQMLLQQQQRVAAAPVNATAIQQQQFSPNCNLQSINGALAMAQTVQRSDSCDQPAAVLNQLEMLIKANPMLGAAFQQQQQVQTAQFLPTSTPTLLQFPLLNTGNIMIPSPSLPNLCNGLFASMAATGGAGQPFIGGGTVPATTTQPTFETAAIDATASSVSQQTTDYTNLMLQASNFATFLSLPSLLRTHALLQPASMLDNPSIFIGSSDQDSTNETATNAATGGGNSSGASQRPSVRFDSSARGGQPALPIGGYPSLLKQQLRDLVLRRKSLVREEPEEQMGETLSSSSSTAATDALANIAKKLQQKHRKISLDKNHLKTGLAYESSMAKHQCLCAENNNHVEHGGRVQSIWARLISSGLATECERVPLKKATLELLRLVHSPTYVTFFAVSPTACLKLDPSELPLKSFFQLPCGGIGVDSDTYFNDASTQMASRVAVGLLVELVSQVQEGRMSNGFACIRPPGHHAEREQAMGFCFFNNVSIAARHLQQRYQQQCSRIAIIDWDVHHGNGTQLAFEADPHVLYISLHRHDNGNFFPGTGAVTEVGVGDGKGFTVNIPFSGDIMGDAEYLAAWRVLVVPLLDSFKPDFCLVSAGFDATRGHAPALGGYDCSPQLFGYFTRSLMSYAGGRVVLALEGGYDLPSICDAVETCVKALRGTSLHRSGAATESDREIATGFLPVEALERVPNNAAQDTIQKVIAIHKKHWSCLTGIQGINTSELHWQSISQRFSSLTVEP